MNDFSETPSLEPVSVHHFSRTVQLPCSCEEAFRWHQRGALRRLLPPWDDVVIEQAPESLQDGTIAKMRVPLLGPLKKLWVAEHYGCETGRIFCDRQLSGPFAQWEHEHRFRPTEGGCELEDSIAFRLPGGAIGNWLGQGWVRRQLDRMFRFRHEVTRGDLAAHHAYRGKTMRIAITGSSGLVGSQLIPFLEGGGHDIVRIVRRKAGEGEVQWDPERETIDSAGLEGLDAVIHLAGESIAEGRWDDAKKRRIMESRVGPTRLLATTLAGLQQPPKMLLAASAIGYYGERGDEEVDENSEPGDSFLADVCQQWEQAAEPAQQAGIRVVNGRIGIVLSPKGGALKPMLLPFKMGMGGVVGSGKQFWSFIALDDLVGAMHHCVMTDTLSGPVNLVAPHPVTNREFTKALGTVLSRPTLIPIPSFGLRVLLGEMADALILTSTRVVPTKLQQSGYEFRYPDIEGALRHVLGR